MQLPLYFIFIFHTRRKIQFVLFVFCFEYLAKQIEMSINKSTRRRAAAPPPRPSTLPLTTTITASSFVDRRRLQLQERQINPQKPYGHREAHSLSLFAYLNTPLSSAVATIIMACTQFFFFLCLCCFSANEQMFKHSQFLSWRNVVLSVFCVLRMMLWLPGLSAHSFRICRFTLIMW